MLEPPTRTRVPDWPTPPATLVGGTPAVANGSVVVVRIGVERLLGRTHHKRYSALPQTRGGQLEVPRLGKTEDIPSCAWADAVTASRPSTAKRILLRMDETPLTRQAVSAPLPGGDRPRPPPSAAQ